MAELVSLGVQEKYRLPEPREKCSIIIVYHGSLLQIATSMCRDGKEMGNIF